MTTLRWGILGTGNIARRFASSLALSRTGTLRAAASRSADSAAAFACAHKVETFPDYETLLAHPEIDAFYIATPHPTHARWCLAAARAGKHILCEKPATMTFAEADAVIAEVRAAGVFFMEAFMYRCHPQTARVLEIVRSGRLGEIRLVEASFSFDAGYQPASRLFARHLGGGGILDVGCYTTSMARMIAGAAAGADGPLEPVSVKGAAVRDAAEGTDLFATALLEFPGGLLATLAAGVQLSLGNTVRITGRKGTLTVTSPWFAGAAGAELRIQETGRPTPEVLSSEDASDLYVHEIDLVAANATQGEAPFPAMTWADTLGNMRVLDAWRAEARVSLPCDNASEMTEPLGGGSLTRRTEPLPQGFLPGLAKPVSRIVIGGMMAASRAGRIVLDDYFEQGGNAFDTAYIYGDGACDRALGEWMSTRSVREEVAVIAKGAHTPFCNPEGIMQQLELSLEAMQTDHADIYIMHRDNEEIPVGEFIDVLNQLRSEGRFAVFGCSNWKLKRLRAAHDYAARHGVQGFGLLNNQLSLARMIEPVWTDCLSAHDDETRAWLQQNHFPLLAWSSQARGFFSDRVPDAEMTRCWVSPDNLERKRRAAALAAAIGCTETTVALAWVLAQPFPVWALVGPECVSELRSTLRAAQLALTPHECAWLDLSSADVPERCAGSFGN